MARRAQKIDPHRRHVQGHHPQALHAVHHQVRAARVGQYVQAHLGGIMGNFLFGCMLGSTGVVGAILGLPLDIRHIAFSSANLGYALAGLEFQLGAAQIAWAVFGVLAIGAGKEAVRFVPPFILQDGELDEILAAFAGALSEG